jgi:hypothetical protein
METDLLFGAVGREMAIRLGHALSAETLLSEQTVTVLRARPRAVVLLGTQASDADRGDEKPDEPARSVVQDLVAFIADRNGALPAKKS